MQDVFQGLESLFRGFSSCEVWHHEPTVRSLERFNSNDMDRAGNKDDAPSNTSHKLKFQPVSHIRLVQSQHEESKGNEKRANHPEIVQDSGKEERVGDGFREEAVNELH